MQGNDGVQELRDTERSGKDAQPEPHGVVLVGAEEEETICEDGPHKDVGKDTGDEALGVGHCDGTIPVDGHEGPCQRAGDDGGMDEAWVGVVAEGEGGEVEEVDDQDDLGPGEMGTGEEHDEGEVEKVVEDEVRAYGGSGIDLFNVAREEVQDIADLQDEQDDARTWSGSCYAVGEGSVDLQVNGDKREVEREAGQVEKILAWDGPAVLDIIGRGLDRVVSRDDDSEKPCEQRQDLVGNDGFGAVGVPLREGVD